ncbi:Phosphoadenylyl-sulfate reductase [Nitrincola lacisaponensis]|uniref:Adenosine 5'-phosphosulfate reductase n=1 Tax=Nitrincola lacisaponensis TaxID=267850 RepID=A0A063Y1L8_9GAMM|nr:phosphoadenylyl-sulfate reductase [Nitrincola lacisaponensis]KDE38671.1 Phosphoadenylyl-sulfate reductase [Nitrincola lacisaponensis]
MSDQLTPELQQKIDQVVTQLREATAQYQGNLVLANSLGAEDMVLADLLARYLPDISQFVLDTGRLPEETLTLLARVTEHYPQLQVDVYYPEAAAVEAYVREQGINAFYQSQELRKACCGVRKLEPLKRALTGRAAWITGLRREQSVTRDTVAFSEWDAANGLQKLNPLADWSTKEIWAYLRHFNVPYNELHDRHYPSIGCAPCTRAISVGEDVRAGRWWWENPENRECGLHAASSIPLRPR